MKARRRARLVVCVLVLVGALVVTVVGRGANPANSLARLGSVSSSGTTLYVDFESVVNLPLGARVLSRGTNIGALDSIELADDAARLKLRIDANTVLPTGTTAELRQTTILGDIYVALTPPSTRNGTVLGDGDLIPLQDTDPGPQIEDIIVNLANFMSGGSLVRVQDALRQVNASVDVPGADLGVSAGVGARDIEDLARSTDSLGAMIGSLQRTSAEIASTPDDLGFSMGPEGQISVGLLFNAVSEGFELVAGTSSLAFGLNWLTPRLSQLNPFLAKLVPLLRTQSSSSRQFNGNSGKLIDLVQNRIAPFARDGSPVSLDRVTLGNKETDVTASVATLLRMIGALR